LALPEDSPELLEPPLVDDEPESPPDSAPELEPEPSLEPELSLEPPSVEDVLLLALVRVPLVDERSFFAQPDPLKCTVGVESAFFMVPSLPHDGQKRGPASLIPWITSVTCRQFEQR
jgi:hypothetical protein